MVAKMGSISISNLRMEREMHFDNRGAEQDVWVYAPLTLTLWRCV